MASQHSQPPSSVQGLPRPVSFFSPSPSPQPLPPNVQKGDYSIPRTALKPHTASGVNAVRRSNNRVGFDGNGQKSFKALSGDELHAVFNPIKLEDALPLMGTGDILGFYGSDAAVDNFNRTMQGNSWFNHVDMIVRDPPDYVLTDFGIPPDPTNVYVFETNVDESGGTFMYGIHLFLEMYQRRLPDSTYVFWRRLVDTGRGPGVQAYPGLPAMLMKARRLPYEKNPSQFMLGLLHRSTEDLSSIFCSEAVMWAFKTMGLVSQDTVCSNYMPIDFCFHLRPDRIKKRQRLGRHEPERLLLLE
eukprot:RCo044823